MTFEDIIEHLKTTRNLHLLREKTDNVSNKLYFFIENGTNIQFVLKGLLPTDFEVQAFSEYLPKINNTFSHLILPHLLETYKDDKFVYLLIPFYSGETFDFNTTDINLTDQLVGVVQDLFLIDVESVIAGGSNFDYEGFEARFWDFFNKAISLGLIDGSVKDQCFSLLELGRKNQKMIISNGDFNPRNVIRLKDNRLVLIDWNGIVSPLEHHLTYCWLLNWQNPIWQKEYACKFEKSLPVENSRTRMHLMNISLLRAVGEKGHNNPFADNMARNHIKNFYASLKGFTSLTDLCG
ncbi:hypothetical protein M1437_00555 [Patescibacteria group bacterium]|nr:hypothetical protein [Patescibacteria group bacterium]